MLLASQATSLLWVMNAEQNDAMSKITTCSEDKESTFLVKRPQTVPELKAFFPKRLGETSQINPAAFRVTDFFGSCKYRVEDIVEIFDYLFKHFLEIQAGKLTIDNLPPSEIPTVAELAFRFVSKSKVKLSGGAKASNQQPSKINFCMVAIFEAIFIPQYRLSTLSRAGGKIRQMIVDTLSLYAKEGVSMDEFWADGMVLEERAFEDEEEGVMNTNEIKTLARHEESIQMRHRHEAVINKLARTIEELDFVQACKDDSTGIIHTGVVAALHKLVGVSDVSIYTSFSMIEFIYYLFTFRSWMNQAPRSVSTMSMERRLLSKQKIQIIL